MRAARVRAFVRERRRAILTVVAAAALAGSVAALIARAADYARVVDVMREGNKA